MLTMTEPDKQKSHKIVPWVYGAPLHMLLEIKNVVLPLHCQYLPESSQQTPHG